MSSTFIKHKYEWYVILSPHVYEPMIHLGEKLHLQLQNLLAVQERLFSRKVQDNNDRIQLSCAQWIFGIFTQFHMSKEHNWKYMKILQNN